MAPNPYLKAIAPDAAKKAAAPSPSKSSGSQNGKHGNKGKATAKGAAAPRSQEEEALRQEILALGGDDADLELLAGVGSDSELEGDDEAEGSHNKSADTVRLCPYCLLSIHSGS
jgi:ribosome biogenesis protein MAK21